MHDKGADSVAGAAAVVMLYRYKWHFIHSYSPPLLLGTHMSQ